jgi:hypothetical protein
MGDSCAIDKKTESAEHQDNRYNDHQLEQGKALFSSSPDPTREF